VLKERGADSGALCIGVDEEVIQHVALNRREGDDAAVLLDDPGLVLGQETLADEPAGLLGCVERREPGLGGTSGPEDFRDRVGVCGRGASEHGRRLRGCHAIRTSPSG